MRLLYILLFTLVTTTTINSQTISPVESNEYCPGVEYTFTVYLPGSYTGITASGGATVTLPPPQYVISTFTFKGTFSDVNHNQSFTISYKTANGGTPSKEFKFDKVKSLFYGSFDSSNSFNPIIAPLCQTTPIPFTFSSEKWKNQDNQSVGFGSIDTYEYLIPAGWYLNSTLSTGSNWIQASNNITLTPNTNSGTGSQLQFRAINNCNSISNFKGNINNVPISRPTPSFTILPASMPIVCGTTPTQTFTVNSSTASACSVSYIWNLGANNGWLYAGSPAPDTITTSSNSITLTSANGNTLPASVYVTPIYNNVAQTQLKCTTDFTPFTSTAVISGINSYCNLQSASMFTIDAGAGNTVTWSSSNSGIATVSGGTDTQVVVTAQSQGLFYVNARITNPCGQWVDKTSFAITVGTPMALIDGYTCVTESAPCLLNATANNNYLAFSLSAPTGTYTPLDSDWQWEKISGNFYFLENGQYNSPTHTGKQCNIYISGTNPTDAPMKFKCRVRNACAWGEWRTYIWNDGTTTPVVPPTPPANYFKVAPNPTGGYAANISLLNSSILPPTTSPIIVRLYNIFGQLLSTTQLYNNSGQVFVYSFPYTTMYLTITFDSHTENITIVK
jgi:hypothetical protein